MLPEPTQAELLDILRITACQLTKFIGLPADELEGELWTYLPALLPKWDRVRPLAGYLFIALRNKALNENRRRVGRPKAERPADSEKGRAWDANRRRRRLIHGPASQTIRRPEADKPEGRERVDSRADHEGEVDAADLSAWLRGHLPDRLKGEYDRLLAGEKIPVKTLNEIRAILG